MSEDSVHALLSRLGQCTMRLGRAHVDSVEEGTALVLDAFMQVFVADNGWFIVLESEGPLLSQSSGDAADRLDFEDFGAAAVDAMHGAQEVLALDADTAMTDEIAQILGRYVLCIPLPLDEGVPRVVVVFRNTTAFSEQEEEVCRTLAQMAFGTLHGQRLRSNVAQLQRELAETEASAAVKSQFLATMSHEIRTPMNGILGMAQLLMDTRLDAEQREFLGTIQSSAKSLLTIINDVLDFSKVESGNLVLDPVEFDVVNMLEEVTTLVGERADPKGIDVVCLQPSPLPARFVGDEGRIRQVLINLVGNAVKFTMDGTVVIRTAVQTSVGDQYTLKFQVEDSGIGIPAEKLDGLFQSFTQAEQDTTRRFGGTGLGLAISKRLVELLGGTIGVTSTVGEGSTFWFTVPIERVNSPRRTLDFSPELRGRTLWLGSDNAYLVEALQQIVGVHGLTIRGFSERDDILERDLDADADFIVLDESGEDWNRGALAKMLAAKTSMPILALLRTSERESLRTGRNSMWSGSLIKPFRTTLVLHSLRGVSTANNEDARQSDQIADAEVTHLKKPTRVLLAEDSAINRTIAERMLQKLGFEMDVVHNGLEAVEACKESHYEIVLMDCQMPVIDGYQATRRIRAHFGKRKGPVIVALTANAGAAEKQKCLEAGMDDHLSKPFSPDKLEETMNTWAQKIAAAQGHPSATR